MPLPDSSGRKRWFSTPASHESSPRSSLIRAPRRGWAILPATAMADWRQRERLELQKLYPRAWRELIPNGRHGWPATLRHIHQRQPRHNQQDEKQPWPPHWKGHSQTWQTRPGEEREFQSHRGRLPLPHMRPHQSIVQPGSARAGRDVRLCATAPRLIFYQNPGCMRHLAREGIQVINLFARI
jgi:hypothetical protein